MKRDRERPLVRQAAERRAVVLIGLPEGPPVGGKQHHDPPIAAAHAVAAVVEHDPINRHGFAQINLPPGFHFLGGMEAPCARLDAVAAARGVLFGRDVARGRLARAAPRKASCRSQSASIWPGVITGGVSPAHACSVRTAGNQPTTSVKIVFQFMSNSCLEGAIWPRIWSGTTSRFRCRADSSPVRAD